MTSPSHAIALHPRHADRAEATTPSSSPVARVVELRRPVAAEREGAEPARLGGMLAWSVSMKNAFTRVARVAATDLPVMIQGPSGTGKELVARAVHDSSPRADAPFVALNCGALSATLIESELFGYAKGAFTGATHDKRGAFEAAADGTIFLDEIGELPLEMQPKLLRVLETMSIRRVGEASERPIDVRVVAATHCDLGAMVEAGTFREDLYHRLVVLSVQLPALKDRPEDIVGLAQTFAAGRALSEAALQRLVAHGWSGNVRELKNTILRACVLSDADVLDAGDIELLQKRSGVASSPTPALHDELTFSPDSRRARYVEALRVCGYNRAKAARQLGIPRSTFHAQLERLGIPRKFER
ncbi:MAG: sigma-54 dependent transcriptional regulator [Deltaproteobacteria bacterium]